MAEMRTVMDWTTLTGLALALAAGLLIGLERGWHQRELPDGQRVAGLRTFGLIGLLGGLSGLLAERWGAGVLIALLAAVALLLLAGYVVAARRLSVMGLTTAMAALATFLIGVLASGGAWSEASILAVVVVALLQAKDVLHAAIGKLTQIELNSGIRLLLISVVILPILPDRTFGPLGGLNPYRLWWSVVLLSLLSFIGFILMRWLGPRRGMTLTALLGGLVSSTATTATMARWAREAPAWRPLAAGGATLACAAMFARMALLVGVAAPSLGWTPVAIFTAMGIAGATLGAIMTARAPRDGLPELQVSNPLKLTSALQFSAFLGVVMLVARVLANWLGDTGVLLTAAISGLIDVDAITLSIAQMVGSGGLATSVAALALFVAAGVNQITKLSLLAALDSKTLALKVLPAYLAMAALGLAVAYLVR